MQFLTSLFGGSENTVITAILALGIVLVLIVLGLWTLKLFFRASNNLVRGRNKRLMVIDQVSLDQKRQLIIVRRDNVEHLILTGGPQDLVVEAGIVAEKPVSGPSLRPPAGGPTGTGTVPVTSEDPKPKSITPSMPAPNAAMERLREIARPAAKRPSSLRHTGLMRPVTRMEAAVIPMNPESTDRHALDSARTGPQSELSEQAKLGAGTYHADGVKAEGK